MANDTVSMTTIFRACYDILDNRLIPLHYTGLTKLALQSLGVNMQSVNYQKQIEDIREKLPKDKRYGVFYTGAPLCLVGLKCWFESDQLYLLNGDVTRPIVIDGNVNSGIAGAFESLMRYPHMMWKNKAVPESKRAMGCASGLVIERHVVDWFKTNWPDMILPPDNNEKFDKPCNHDFKIKAGESRIIFVDIWGPNSVGEYSKPPLKKSTHFHLQCRADGDHIMWECVMPGKLYDMNKTLPEVGLSPRRLVVWLNCLKNNLPYNEIRRFA